MSARINPSTSKWDYECPMFLDFSQDLDGTQCQETFNFDLNVPSLKLRTPDARKEESKPKTVKTVKTGSKFSSLRGPNIIISKPSEESYNLNSRLLNRLSKSDSSINRNCNKVKPPAARSMQDISSNTCRKRSISGVDSKWKNKKTFPVTPMCLKRTMCKSKAKRTKTTEEMELEKIAQLQKELADHLKYNENSLRRLKLKVGVAPIQTNIPKKAEVSSRIKTLKEDTESGGNKAAGVAPPKNVSAIIKNMRLKAQNDKALLVKSTDVQNMVETNNWLVNSSKKDITKTQSLHVPGTCKPKDLLSKMPSAKQYDAHCGIPFYHNRKKKTLVKPFSFDARVKEFTASMKKEVEKKIHLSDPSSSLQTPWPKDITKENFSPNKTSYSAEKFSFNPKEIKVRYNSFKTPQVTRENILPNKAGFSANATKYEKERAPESEKSKKKGSKEAHFESCDLIGKVWKNMK